MYLSKYLNVLHFTASHTQNKTKQRKKYIEEMKQQKILPLLFWKQGGSLLWLIHEAFLVWCLHLTCKKITGSTKGVNGSGMDFLSHLKSMSIKQTIGDPPTKKLRLCCQDFFLGYCKPQLQLSSHCRQHHCSSVCLSRNTGQKL